MWRDEDLISSVRCIGVAIKPLISLLSLSTWLLGTATDLISTRKPRASQSAGSSSRKVFPPCRMSIPSISPTQIGVGWGEERRGRGLRVGVWKEGCRPRNGREVKAREWRKKTDGRKCLSGLHGWLNDGMAGMCQTKLVRRVL